jgi:hypothetical protein
MRIFGPGKSAMTATWRPEDRAAARMRTIVYACPEKSPWEKLTRAIFIPAWIIRSRTSGESEDGPMVATILVLFTGKGTPASS